MKKVLKNQYYHLFIYLFLGTLLYFATQRYADDQILWGGLNSSQLVLLSWILAGLHQGWIALGWRLEFHYKLFSKWFGKKAFLIFKVGFAILIVSRMFLIIPISFTSPESINIPQWLFIVLVFIPLPFILWGIYSVIFYFGMSRAFGADHFDPAYREKTLELRGTFKYIPNSMYTVVLLLLYHPALFYNSKLGILTALIHHTFVWTHYFCTEKPDIKEIYGSKAVRIDSTERSTSV